MNSIIHIVIGEKTIYDEKEGDEPYKGFYYPSKEIAGCFFDEKDAVNFIEEMRVKPSGKVGCSGTHPFLRCYNKMYVKSGPIKGTSKKIVNVENK